MHPGSDLALAMLRREGCRYGGGGSGVLGVLGHVHANGSVMHPGDMNRSIALLSCGPLQVDAACMHGRRLGHRGMWNDRVPWASRDWQCRGGSAPVWIMSASLRLLKYMWRGLKMRCCLCRLAAMKGHASSG